MKVKKLVLMIALVITMSLPALACNTLDSAINRGMNGATNSAPTCGNIVC